MVNPPLNRTSQDVI